MVRWWERWSRLRQSGFGLCSVTGILHGPRQVVPDPPDDCTSNGHRRHSWACGRLWTQRPASASENWRTLEGCFEGYEVEDDKVDSRDGMQVGESSSSAGAGCAMFPS